MGLRRQAAARSGLSDGGRFGVAARVADARGLRRTPRPSGIVTLLTDFGLEDPYVGIVKGVILAINPAARLVDLTHAVPPQDVLRGALALEAAYRFFPRGTVHLAVIDPGVGGPRRPVAVLAEGHCFVGPDNGLLGLRVEAPGARTVALTNPAYYRAGSAGVSRTFHARDLFAAVAAHRSLGVPFERLGPPVPDPAGLRLPRPRRVSGVVVGQVLLADRFGNLLTNVDAGLLPAPPAACVVEVAGSRIEGVVGTYSQRPVGDLGAVVDGSGRVEIFVREGSARERLGIGPGAEVSFSSRSSRRAARPGSSPTHPPWTFPPTASRRRPARCSSSPRSSPSSATPKGSRSRTTRRPSG
jgi:S-adenosyl-L-methionine hydrolase (adenosine-forming)